MIHFVSFKMRTSRRLVRNESPHWIMTVAGWRIRSRSKCARLTTIATPARPRNDNLCIEIQAVMLLAALDNREVSHLRECSDLYGMIAWNPVEIIDEGEHQAGRPDWRYRADAYRVSRHVKHA